MLQCVRPKLNVVTLSLLTVWVGIVSVWFHCFHLVFFYLQLYSIVFYLFYSVPQYLTLLENMLDCLEQYVLEFIGSNLINKTCKAPSFPYVLRIMRH